MKRLDEFERNVQYLKRNIAPDDIYLFAEQMHMGMLFFMKKWSEWEDVGEACESCDMTKKWAMNALALEKYKRMNLDIEISVNFSEVDEDYS